jgi:sialic acid synthase
MKIIAEVGCNHLGKMDIAQKCIISAAMYCEVDAIKFQKRTISELLTPEEYNQPHPNPENSYGDTYGAHREYLELDINKHRLLKEWCEDFNVEYSSSVWDLISTKEIASLNPKSIKIPSACNMKWKMLTWLTENFPGEIHVSLGMTKPDEIKDIVEFFCDMKRNKDVILYSCTSGYPVPFKDVCLLEIKKLKEKYEKQVKGIGFSGHHLGIAIDNAALTLGAEWIERHFTLDRTWKGTDHAASLEPDGMRKLVRDLKATKEALSYKFKDILEIEQVQRKKLKRNK